MQSKLKAERRVLSYSASAALKPQLCFWFVIGVLTFVPMVALAAGAPHLNLESSNQFTLLDSNTTVLQDNTEVDSADSILKKIRSGAGSPRLDLNTSRLFGRDIYWLSTDLKTDSKLKQEWFLDTGYAKYQRVDLFLYGPDGRSHKVSGATFPWHEKDYPHENIAFSLELTPNTDYTVLVRIESGNYLPLSLWMVSKPYFHRMSRTIGFLTALVLGLFFAVFIYNLFIYMQTKDPMTGSLVMVVFTATAYYTGYRTILGEYIFMDVGVVEPTIIFGFPGFFLTALMASAPTFVRHLLNTQLYEPKFDAFLKYCSYAVYLLCPFWFFEEYWWTLLNILYIFGPLATLLFAAIVVRSVNKHNPATRLFIYAQSPFLFAGTVVAYVYNGPFSSLERTLAILFAMFCGASTALAYSLIIGSIFNEDRQKRLQLQENMTEQLEQDVEERTTELAHKTLEAQEATLEALNARDQAETLYRKAEVQAAELEILSNAKNSFFQNISHELRTPLTLIINPLENLVEELPNNKHASVAIKNSRRLLRLVNQLLNYQKLDAGKEVIDLEPIELSKFIHICEDYFVSSCSTKKIQFFATIDKQPANLNKTPLFIDGNLDALEKITFNYLSNALKYTPHGGQIELGLITTDDNIEIFVRDSGPGIAEADQGKLFNLFSQVEDSSTREYEGTGLGLALVKSLTHEMNGTVGIESVVGEGSKFRATFPTCPAPEQNNELDFQARSWLLQDITINALSGDELTNPSTEDLENFSDGSGEVILVVDDLADMRDLVADALSAKKYKTVKASNGQQAYDIACKIKPTLIVTDWMMPRMSGPQLIEAIRNHDELYSTPIVLLTAKSDEESKLIGTDIGADSFLGKPFNQQELTSTVRNLVALKKREHEVEALNRMLTEKVLKRYLPPDLVDQIIDGSISLDQEPEHVMGTVLFSDLVGFTRLSEELSAAKLAKILNEYLSAMVQVIYEHNGTIDKFIGDAIMIIFGAPRAMVPEQQVEQAAKCAHGMQARLHELNVSWEKQNVDLAMRIGIHHGPVVAGTFGSTERSDYTVIGPTVNIASRIEGQCLPGQVFASQEVSLLLPNAASTALGEFELKGVEGKRHLHRLLDLSQPHGTIKS
ncbi:MAG: response regulator [Deltaproteobacteria bacterium]|nr:response regulator [Deltaproteobacteria bacterium]